MIQLPNNVTTISQVHENYMLELCLPSLLKLFVMSLSGCWAVDAFRCFMYYRTPVCIPLFEKLLYSTHTVVTIVPDSGGGENLAGTISLILLINGIGLCFKALTGSYQQASYFTIFFTQMHGAVKIFPILA